MKLQMKEKLISLHHKMIITDEAENMVYEVASNAVTLTDKTHITNAKGEEVAYVHTKLLTLHHTYFAEMANGMHFEIREELLHLVKDVLNIEGLGWQVRGDFMEHDYEIVDASEQVLMHFSRKWLSLHDVCYLDIREEAQMDVLVTVCVILEHILDSRKNERAVAAGTAGAAAATAADHSEEQ